VGGAGAAAGLGPQVALDRNQVLAFAAAQGVPPLPVPHPPLGAHPTQSWVFMPLLAAALDCTHDGQAALRDHMGGAYYDWLVRMFREDLRARGVRAAVKNWGVFKADRSLGYLAASVQEALLLPSLPGVAWNEADWRTPSSDAQTPQAALACMVGVPRSFLPPYVYGTLTAWVHLVNEPTPDWFATDWLHASDALLPPQMRTSWPGFP